MDADTLHRDAVGGGWEAQVEVEAKDGAWEGRTRSRMGVMATRPSLLRGGSAGYAGVVACSGAPVAISSTCMHRDDHYSTVNVSLRSRTRTCIISQIQT